MSHLIREVCAMLVHDVPSTPPVVRYQVLAYNFHCDTPLRQGKAWSRAAPHLPAVGSPDSLYAVPGGLTPSLPLCRAGAPE